jgi:hypothetical protein
VADPYQLTIATKLLARGPARHSLERFTMAVLKTLCSNNDLTLPVIARGKKLRKAQILDVLEDFLVSLIHVVQTMMCLTILIP